MISQGKFMVFSFQEFQNFLNGYTVNRKIKLIQNHHTWQPDYKAWRKIPNYFHWLESMEKYQVEQNGFAQIAQNLTTFPDGYIALCRPFDVSPAGIKGANQYGICMEHVGNFDIGGDEMTNDHKDTIVKLNALLCKAFGVPINAQGIVYHHWYDIITGARTNGSGTVKTCPGTNFFGGNKVEDMEAHFLPLVNNALKTL